MISAVNYKNLYSFATDKIGQKRTVILLLHDVPTLETSGIVSLKFPNYQNSQGLLNPNFIMSLSAYICGKQIGYKADKLTSFDPRCQ
jgi:hypothetical protein